MKNVLDKLYKGEIYPEEQILPTDPEYRPNQIKIDEELKFLSQKLSSENAARLEELNTLYQNSLSMTSYAGFCYGYKLGARLMRESLCEDIAPKKIWAETSKIV